MVVAIVVVVLFVEKVLWLAGFGKYYTSVLTE